MTTTSPNFGHARFCPAVKSESCWINELGMWRHLRSRRGGSFGVSATELVTNSDQLSALEFGHAQAAPGFSRSDQSGRARTIGLAAAQRSAGAAGAVMQPR